MFPEGAGPAGGTGLSRPLTLLFTEREALLLHQATDETEAEEALSKAGS